MVFGKGLLLGLFAFAAWGQTSEKVFYFAHLETPQALQEVTNVIRMAGDIQDVFPVAANRSVTVKGTAEQIAVGAWLAAELDKPGGAAGTRDFTLNDARAPLAQVAYLTHLETPRELQEVVNAIRSVMDLQRCFPLNQQKAIVMRGAAWQVKGADWLLGLLDRPAGALPAGGAAPDFQVPDGGGNAFAGLVVRVVALSHLETPQAIQELTNVTRSIADMQRCFPVQSRRVLVMRGNDDQMALADWLSKQFDAPAGEGTKEFKMGGAGAQIVQVAFVNALTPQSLMETVNAIRTETKMQRVFPFPPGKAVAMRGTADELARAQQAIQSRQGK